MRDFRLFVDKEEAGRRQRKIRGKGDQGSIPLADFIAKAESLVAGKSIEL
jgi:threonyl-tRNA synthetase